MSKSKSTTTVEEIESLILDMRDDKRAKELIRFFKVSPGNYGEGDKFLGIPNPKVRWVLKEVWRDCTLNDAAALAKNEWHEIRLVGLLILVNKMLQASKKNNVKEMDEICKLYLSLHPYINNWDLVDLSAYKIVGTWEEYHLRHNDFPEWGEGLMDSWAMMDDSHLWQRRISMISTWLLIRNGYPEVAISRAEALLDSKHDLLHKASGWMLREVYKKDGELELEAFLDKHVTEMAPVMLSYACEKMDPHRREYWKIRRRGGEM